VTGNSILRRDVLRSLGIGLAAGSVARVIPLQAAEYAHKVIREEKTPKGSYQPKFFTAHQYKTLQGLCAAIIPPARSQEALSKQARRNSSIC
jgi:hypothetical protein